MNLENIKLVVNIIIEGIHMSMQETALEIMKRGYVCDHCLGRAFASLLTGYTNEERGRIIRHFIAMQIDSGEKIKIDERNLYGIKFRNIKIEAKRPIKCSICGDIFKEIKKKVKLILNELEKYDYKTFLVGSNPPDAILNKEQELWDKVGIEWAESIRTEINREIGKEVERQTGRKLDRKTPDITILYDFKTDTVRLDVRSIFIFGRYQKFVRNIPQTKWKTRIYKTSVQSIIAKPLVKQTKAEDTSFHGEGREDVNVRCFAWRPFVIELLNPKIRKVNLALSQKEINKSKKAKVKDLKFVDRKFVKHLKSVRHDKTYRALVKFEKPLENLKILKDLIGKPIMQQTPNRVLQRRVDKMRKRFIKDLKYKLLNKKTLELTVKTQAGLYVKELIHGDNGRTQPNIQDMLNNKVKSIELDVIKIHE